MTQRIVQIVPAAAGWRLAFAYLGVMGPLEEMTNDQLIGISPIACFALVQGEEAGEQYVKPVCPEDWPSYLWLVDGVTQDAVIDHLAPGDELEDLHRQEAIDQIKSYRAARATEAPA